MNLRLLGPEPSALTGLRYIPTGSAQIFKKWVYVKHKFCLIRIYQQQSGLTAKPASAITSSMSAKKPPSFHTQGRVYLNHLGAYFIMIIFLVLLNLPDLILKK